MRNIRFTASKRQKARNKEFLFLKNKAGELLKTKDEPEKQTGNKAETKLAKSLETIETPKKQSENKPENKAGHLVENKRSDKNKPKTNRKPLLCSLSCCAQAGWSRLECAGSPGGTFRIFPEL